MDRRDRCREKQQLGCPGHDPDFDPGIRFSVRDVRPEVERSLRPDQPVGQFGGWLFRSDFSFKFGVRFATYTHETTNTFANSHLYIAQIPQQEDHASTLKQIKYFASTRIEIRAHNLPACASLPGRYLPYSDLNLSKRSLLFVANTLET